MRESLLHGHPETATSIVFSVAQLLNFDSFSDSSSSFSKEEGTALRAELMNTLAEVLLLSQPTAWLYEAVAAAVSQVAAEPAELSPNTQSVALDILTLIVSGGELVTDTAAESATGGLCSVAQATQITGVGTAGPSSGRRRALLLSEEISQAVPLDEESAPVALARRLLREATSRRDRRGGSSGSGVSWGRRRALLQASTAGGDGTPPGPPPAPGATGGNLVGVTLALEALSDSLVGNMAVPGEDFSTQSSECIQMITRLDSLTNSSRLVTDPIRSPDNSSVSAFSPLPAEWVAAAAAAAAAGAGGVQVQFLDLTFNVRAPPSCAKLHNSAITCFPTPALCRVALLRTWKTSEVAICESCDFILSQSRSDQPRSRFPSPVSAHLLLLLSPGTPPVSRQPLGAPRAGGSRGASRGSA